MSLTERLLEALVRYRAGRIAGSLVEFLQPGQCILDCGGGAMLVAGELEREAGVKAFGTDLIQLDHGHTRFCLCSGEKLAFQTGSFDCVCLISVLHHTPDPIAVLQECLRVAKNRVIIHEDVFQNKFELAILKALDRVSNDFISKDMNHPGSFKMAAEWKAVFNGLGLNLTAVRIVRPLPWRPSRHRLFVLDKQA